MPLAYQKIDLLKLYKRNKAIFACKILKQQRPLNVLVFEDLN